MLFSCDGWRCHKGDLRHSGPRVVDCDNFFLEKKTSTMSIKLQTLYSPVVSRRLHDHHCGSSVLLCIICHRMAKLFMESYAYLAIKWCRMIVTLAGRGRRRGSTGAARVQPRCVENNMVSQNTTPIKIHFPAKSAKSQVEATEN